MGCILATSENVIFKLVGSSEHAQFKNMIELSRTPSGQMGTFSSNL